MRKKKLSRLLEPGFQLYFICLAVFAAASLLLSPELGATEGLVVILLYIYFRRSNAQRQREILKYIDNVTCNVDVATKDTMINAPLPMVIFRPESDEVIWSNDRFLQLTGEREHLFDTKLSSVVPGFSSRWLMEGKTECPAEVELSGRRFLVFGHLVRTDEKGAHSFLATTYWVDVTDYSSVRDEYYGSRPVCAILTVDNYEELMKGISDNEKSSVVNAIDEQVSAWARPTGGLLCKYDRDRYLFFLEERFLPLLREGKFAVLDAVRGVLNAKGMPATLSIGIGRDAPTFQDLFQYASLSVEMALSRGGDQVVIKNQINFSSSAATPKSWSAAPRSKAGSCPALWAS